MAANEKLDGVKGEVNETLVDKDAELEKEDLNDEDYDEDEEEEDFGCYGLGDMRGDECLVCYGEDIPNTFERWLDDIVCKFTGLCFQMEEIGQTLSISDLNEFLEEIGVSIERHSLERFCCSGTFVSGWICPEDQSDVEAQARELLDELRAEVEDVPSETLREALEKVKFQLEEQRSQNAELQKALTASQAAQNEMRANYNALGSFLKQESDLVNPNVWGPFLVTPKAIFVIVEEGGVKLPEGLCNDLLSFIKDISNRPVVCIRDEQYWVYSPLSGSRGTFKPESLEDWKNVWFPKLGFKLQRRVMKPTNAKTVRCVLKRLSTWGLPNASNNEVGVHGA